MAAVKIFRGTRMGFYFGELPTECATECRAEITRCKVQGLRFIGLRAKSLGSTGVNEGATVGRIGGNDKVKTGTAVCKKGFLVTANPNS